MYYFAYGSNMRQAQMRQRCPDSKLAGKAVLKDYALDFTISTPGRWKGGGCADVVARKGAEVWGLLYEVSQSDIENLDRAEGPQYYRRVSLPVQDENGVVHEAYVYEVIHKAPPKNPAQEYLGIITQAANEFAFPESYRAFLNSIQTLA